MLGSLTVVTLAVAVWKPFVYHPEQNPIVKHIELDNAQVRSLLPEASEPIDQSPPAEDIPQDDLDEKVESETGVHEYVVSSGDTLSSILNQYGIDMSDISALAASNSDLRNLKIGQQLSWTVNDDGELQRLTWEKSRRETYTYDRSGTGFKSSLATLQGEWQDRVLRGRLDGSFVTSAKAAGLTTGEISSVVKALQWQLDFKKLRKGRSEEHTSELQSHS